MSETTQRRAEGTGCRQNITARSGAGGQGAGSGAGRHGVTLYRRGHVYSPVSPRATALLVHGSEVAWVGEEAAADGISAETTVDLQGAFVAPAFVDAHVPLPAAGLLAQAVDLSMTVSLSHALADIEEAAAASTAAQVLIAGGCSAARWPEGRLPSPRELDARAHGRLVYLVCPDSASGLPTSGVASSTLLRAVSDSSLDPFGDGFATGAAHELIWAGLVAAAGRSQRLAAYSAARAAAARAGLAAVHWFAPPGAAGAEIAAELAELARAARLRSNDQDARPAGAVDGPVFWAAEVEEATRLGARPGGFVVDNPLPDRAAGNPLPDRAAGNPLPGGVAGNVPPRLPGGAADAVPPWPGRTRPVGGPDNIAAVVAAASRAGVQTSWVAREARAVGDVVAGTARAAEEVGPAAVRASAHRIEGVEAVDEGDLAHLSELGLVVVACPRARHNGPPLAALAAAGAPLALGGGTVSVPYPFDPWATLRAAVRAANPPSTRSRASAAVTALSASALSARAAFAASTRGGWRAARQDADGSGQLVPGSPATLTVWEIQGDLAVRAPDSRVAAWSTDPRAGVGGLPDLEGPAPRCLRTLRHGVVLYDAGALGPL